MTANPQSPPAISGSTTASREDGQYRNQIGEYLQQNSDLRLSHGLCDQCFKTQVDALAVDEVSAPSG